MIETCGFNQNAIDVYVDKFFQENYITAQIVKNKIRESAILTDMVSVPVFTWVICNLFDKDENVNIGSLRTTTHLYSYACLVFILNHTGRLHSYTESSLLT